MNDLFPVDTHDAGGKVRTKLPAGMCGDAVFAGVRQQFRPVLRRWVGIDFPHRYLMFVGMNPSTASHLVNDSTITREWGFTRREGFDGFIKCNVADFRATYPADLLEPGLEVRSPENQPTILALAGMAARVVVCFGAVNRVLRPIADETVAALREAGIELWCFGRTADGSPRHPLYLASDTPLERF